MICQPLFLPLVHGGKGGEGCGARAHMTSECVKYLGRQAVWNYQPPSPNVPLYCLLLRNTE